MPQGSSRRYYRIEPIAVLPIFALKGRIGRPFREYFVGNARSIAFWVVLFVLILALFNFFSNGQTTMSSRSISYSDFIARVDAARCRRSCWTASGF